MITKKLKEFINWLILVTDSSPGSRNEKKRFASTFAKFIAEHRREIERI